MTLCFPTVHDPKARMHLIIVFILFILSMFLCLNTHVEVDKKVNFPYLANYLGQSVHI